MPSDTRQKLIEAAERRFYRDGFRNAGLDQILADVGITKTAFYKHFPSKEDLMLAVLEAHNRWMQEHFVRMVRERGGRSAAGQLRALMDVVEQIINNPEFQGCIFVNVAMEFPLPHEPAHCAAAGHKTAMEEIIYDMAERAGAAEPAALAEELSMIFEGAYVTRQVTANPRTVAIARRLAERCIRSHLPAAAATGGAEGVRAAAKRKPERGGSGSPAT